MPVWNVRHDVHQSAFAMTVKMIDTILGRSHKMTADGHLWKAYFDRQYAKLFRLTFEGL